MGSRRWIFLSTGKAFTMDVFLVQGLVRLREMLGSNK